MNTFFEKCLKLTKLNRQKGLLTILADRPELLFLFIIIPLGILTVFIMPPFAVPDENSHLYRAYQVSQGELTSTTESGTTGGWLPSKLVNNTEIILDKTLSKTPFSNSESSVFLAERINQNDKRFVHFDNTSVYSPIGYIPQSIGIGIARLVYPSELVILYVGRLFNLAAFILMVYLAIKLTPIKKWLFVVVALLPMTIQQAASLSGDVVTIGLSLIAIAYCLKLAVSKKITKKDILISVTIAVLLGLTKQTNVLLVIPFLFLPTKLFLTKKKRLKFSLLIIAAAFGSTILWFGLTKLLHYNMDYSANSAVDMGGQIHALLQYPWHYLKVLFNTYIYNITQTPPSTDFYWISTVGAFSWFKYQLPLFNIILAYVGIFIATIVQSNNSSEEKNEVMLKSQKLFCLALPLTMVVTALAMGSLLYLMWTPVGSPVIAGIQGRYYIPLIPLISTLFISKNFRITANKKLIPIILGIIIVFNIAVMLYQTIRYF